MNRGAKLIRRCGAALSHAILTPLAWLGYGLVRIIFDCTKINGISISYCLSGDSSPRSMKIGEALSIIENYDGRRWLRVRAHIKRVLVADSSVASFQAILGACVIPATMVDDQDPAALAAVVVHEATHALLNRHGVTSDSRDAVRRIELVCHREELRFVQRLPDVDQIETDLLEMISLLERATFDYDAEVEKAIASRGRSRQLIGLRKRLLGHRSEKR